MALRSLLLMASDDDDSSMDDTAIDLSRVCMVGDALETDVVGGSAFEIDTVWVVSDGIHSDDIDHDDLSNSAAKEKLFLIHNYILM